MLPGGSQAKSHDSRETEPLIDSRQSITREDGGLDATQQPSEAVYEHEPSTPSKGLVFRVATAMYSFVVLGLLTASIGVMLPPIERHYNLNDVQVSLIFLVGPIGYVLAAVLNDFVHLQFGQRGIASVAPFFHILSTVAIAAHPPFPVLLLAFAVVAMGNGLLDGSWCAWAGSMRNANTISGLLHGSFSVGAAAGPSLAGAMMSAGHKPWYSWYYVLAGASLLEAIVLAFAFRLESAERYRHDKQTVQDPSNTTNSRAIFRHAATLMSAAYFLMYVGTETAISGWLVSFLTRARHTAPLLASISSSAFWAGMAAGRLMLGAVTDRFGLTYSTLIYFLIAISLEILFVAIKIPIASIVFMALLGFFMGPMFPSGIVLLTQLLPKELHIAAVSFVASIGQVGGAVLPFGIGAVIQGLGIGVFQYAIVIQLVIAVFLWIAFSKQKPSTALE